MAPISSIDLPSRSVIHTERVSTLHPYLRPGGGEKAFFRLESGDLGLFW